MEVQKINELIMELQKIQKEYGNIDCYNITFYIEETNNNKKILTI